MYGLVGGFGEGFGCGAVAVVHQVGSHHPDRRDNTHTHTGQTNTILANVMLQVNKQQLSQIFNMKLQPSCLMSSDWSSWFEEVQPVVKSQSVFHRCVQ